MAAKKHKSPPDQPAGKASASGSALRPFWSGTITFGLVSVPVDVYSALRSSRIPLRMLDEDGTPLRRRYYCPDHEIDVHPEHIVRGYEVADGEHVLVRDDELEAIAPRKSRDIDLTRFVDRDQIPPAYFQRSYFLAPAGESTKAYRLLAEVMERTGRAGLATFVMRGKEYLVVILAEGGILRAETMRFEDELRTPDNVGLPEPVPIDDRTAADWEQAISELVRDELPEEVLRDASTAEMRALVDRKVAAGQDIVQAPQEEEEEGDEADETEPDDDEGGRLSEAGGADLLARIRESLRGGSPHAPVNKGGKRKQPAAGSPRQTASRPPEEEADLDRLSKQELYRRAAEKGIAGRSKMSKQELIRSLQRSA